MKNLGVITRLAAALGQRFLSFNGADFVQPDCHLGSTLLNRAITPGRISVA